jgi:hypothetical protein
VEVAEVLVWMAEVVVRVALFKMGHMLCLRHPIVLSLVAVVLAEHIRIAQIRLQLVIMEQTLQSLWEELMSLPQLAVEAAVVQCILIHLLNREIQRVVGLAVEVVRVMEPMRQRVLMEQVEQQVREIVVEIR